MRVAWWMLACGAFATMACFAQAPLPHEPAAADWNVETLLLKDGTEYRGLLREEGRQQVEFAEIIRRPGRPMSAVVRVVERKQIKRLKRLPEAERAVLAERFRRFRHRAAIEAGTMEQVSLDRLTEGGVSYWVYEGQWFQLRSTADELSTRRCVVRIEQLFRAFRNMLPPRTEPTQTLTIKLSGSIDDYLRQLQKLRLDIDRLAFYSSHENLIVAGCELSRYSQQLTRIRTGHEKLLKQRDRERDEFRESLAKLSEELARQGVSRRTIKQELALRNALWKKEDDALSQQIKEIDRRNNTKFAQVTGRMFRRLHHEAFHAYLMNWAFPHPEHRVPRWLNEGLAQVFERGFLEADTLRVDAPDTTLLTDLKKRLASDDSLTLAKLLNASDDSFLMTHSESASAEHYLYSWGLAYYLVFERAWLRGEALEGYVRGSTASEGAVACFETSVGRSLAEFEKEWRGTMLAMPTVREAESRSKSAIRLGEPSF